MRVLHVIPGLGGGGGAERSLEALAPHLGRKVDLHVAFFEPRQHIRAALEASGAVVHPLDPGTRRVTYLQLEQLLRQLKVDLVHTTLLEADLVGRAAAARHRTPVVSSLVNVNYGREQFRTENFGRSAKRLGIWGADIISARSVVGFHALTEHVASTMGKRLLVPRSRITVIPRGRESSGLGRRNEERRKAARALLSLGESPLVVAAARHERQKGLDVLLCAVPKVLQAVPDARFIIGGRDGLETNRLKELTRDLGVERCVEFIGPRDDVAELMCAADVWCVPSRWEGFGGILVEAMALEVPVVASDIAPIREVAGRQPVFDLVAPDDPAALAAGVVRVLVDRGQAQVRAQAGRARFLSHFTVERTAEQTIEFFESAVAMSRVRKAR